MKRKIIATILAAALLLSNGITAFAAPEVINVNGAATVFDAEYYAAANPDVAAALGTGRDALILHYTLFGMSENRVAYAPGTNVDAYLAAASFQQTRQLLMQHQPVGESVTMYDVNERQYQLFPDGTRIYADGDILLPDLTYIADTYIIYPDGTTIYDNGIVRKFMRLD